MPIEGEVAVRLAWDGARVRRVDLLTRRPRVLTALVRGRSPRAAADLIARVHSLCGAAQGAAAAGAFEAAAGSRASPAVLAARELAVRLESIQEHCLRLGMDWPLALGAQPLPEFVRTIRSALAAVGDAALAHGLARTSCAPQANAIRSALAAAQAAVAAELLGMPPRTWLAQNALADLERWCRAAAVPPARWYAQLCAQAAGVGSSAVALMPDLGAAAVRAAVLPAWSTDEAFVDHPAWRGAPVETGALAANQEHPLVAAALAREGNTVATRLVARLTELARLLDEPAQTPAAIETFASDGAGYALTRTARGLLVHRARVHGPAVADSATLAPTDWNFRSEGPFAAALARLEGIDAEAIRSRVMLVARSLDPCVACAIEVGHA